MDGYITIGTELDTKKFDAQILEVERKVNELEKELSNPKAVELMSSEELLKLQAQLEKAKNKLVQLRQQKKKLEDTKGTSAITEGINNLGNSFQNAVGKAGRLALAIFGIRSAYNMLKRASSDLASYDEQYATNLEYIRFVLTQAVAPVLKWIVQMAMNLLGIINAIVQALFGVNLFANGSAEQFQKMKKGASGVGKAVKEIKKQLMGFDEVNILTDQSDTGTSAGAGGVGMPNMDLSKWQGEPPAWLKWIVDHKDEIIAVLSGIAGGLIAIKLGMSGIKALGFGLIVAGIVYAVESLIKYLKDPSWENFGKIIQGVGIILIGFGVTVGSVALGVIGAVLLIVGTILKYWDQIKGTLEKGIGWLESKSDWIGQQFGGWVKGLYDTFTGWLRLLLEQFDGMFKGIKRIFDGIIQFVKGVFTGNWEEAWNGIKNIFGGVFDWCKAKFNYFFDWVDRIILTPLKSLIDAVVDGIKRALNLGGQLPNLAGGIEVAVNAPRFKTGGIVTIPKLASGGVVNMPNRGTLLGGAVVGESGREGVVPLTDAQAMAELGREIGRNVIINNEIINKMNSRVLSRELIRTQNGQNFAFNG